ncbi:hypothetical protein WA026_003454 [Henosepilachna vigintioctopunctata]|uniref:Basement membrane-specific heparan sulfate proteoglycan core protein n=1 Tax=Henosepilachna vigintioctopunctata TaxID=420089 RepID=A0AAW1TPN5_9CUCU
MLLNIRQNSLKQIVFIRPFFQFLTQSFNQVDQERRSLVGADRTCAEWVLKNGGAIRWLGDQNFINNYNYLPSEDVKRFVEAIDATNSSISHHGFDHLIGCNHIKEMILRSCYYVEDEGLKHLEHLKRSLVHLVIEDCPNITLKGLQHITKQTNLRRLILKDFVYIPNDDLYSFIEQTSIALPSWFDDVSQQEVTSSKAKLNFGYIVSSSSIEIFNWKSITLYGLEKMSSGNENMQTELEKQSTSCLQFSFIMNIATPQCVPGQFQCENGSCINDYQRCDNQADCPNGEDEWNCKAGCRSDQFACGDGECIPLAAKCDRIYNCRDNSDEKKCPCQPDDFHCGNGFCIPNHQRCNGIRNCQDGSDEIKCDSIGPCTSDQWRCSNGECIRKSFRCNSVRDCRDNSDEYRCDECKLDQFRCDNGTCIKLSQRCDGKTDCASAEDEASCAPCKNDQFKCTSGECISINHRCDRRKDCQDNSDEIDCNGKPDRRCQPSEFDCAGGFCIMGYKRCNGIIDCPGGNDEENCPSYPYPPAPRVCTSEELKCNDGSCVIGKKCDRVFDCIDGSDESDCNICSPLQFKCANGDCIDDFSRCDSKIDCSDGSDEEGCVFYCPGEKFRCTDGICLEKNRRCDGYADCNDGSDESGCSNITRCTDNEFDCGNGQCISNDQVCDGRQDCPNGADESADLECPPKHCKPSELTCNDGTCIPQYLQCNGHRECPDGSDEEGCSCTQDQFLCLNGQCIDGSLRCDRRRDCSDGSDEINCPTESPPSPPTERPTPRPSRCPEGYTPCRTENQCVLVSQICDGPVDCRDMSDEEDCAGLNLVTYPNSQDIKENQEVVFQCRDEGPLRAAVRWTRPNNLPLPPGSKDYRGRLEMPNIKVEHSGEYICEAINFPPNARNAQKRVLLKVERLARPTPRPPTACNVYQATCSNGDCIPKEAVCDGRKDCTDGSDEIRCRANGCEPNEFKCANKKCVLKTWRCDGDDDCGDNSDELDCATNAPGSLCLYHHFACHTNNQCISKSYHCDLERDCVDGSDEIGCSKPVIAKNPPPIVTLKIGNFSKSVAQHVNGVGVLTCPDIQPEDQGAYSCESLNSKGATFAIPDTHLFVTTENVCRPGYFNSAAKNEGECIKCFCFGHGTTCRSADLFIYHYQPPFDSLKVVGTRVDPITGTVEIIDGPIYRNGAPQLTAVGLHGVNSYLPPQVELAQSNLIPYFAMPENYHGNQLKSYGGYLRYTINHGNRGFEVVGPDVILSGNGYTLIHQDRQSPVSNKDENKAVRFFTGEWVKRSNDAPETLATREEIMMALANIDNILIKLQYMEGQLNTTISNIVMESAAEPDNNLGAASYVEECTCPVGYSGLSCERCDEGYERHSSGPWLGQCYKISQICPPGTYGDPDRGIPCQTCPCPLTNPANQFGRTCKLAPDGDVVCDCPNGYVGRRCEQCAPGFEGNPMVAGDYCRLKPAEVCNAAGAREASPADGRCQCKNNVDGPTCNQCKPLTFHLNADNQFGCISCFCMGVTSQCGSSTWYKDQVSSAFTSSINDFSIVDIDNRESPITDGIRLNSEGRQILFSSFPSQNVFYWSLPSRYLGNKLTSYGGNLKYTLKYVPLPGGQSSRNSAADVQLISANHIDLLYYAKEQSMPTNSAQTFVVPLLEQYWQRSDGQIADREHLLMALADLKAIYIKATYTTNTMESALVSVSLDTANVRNTGIPERASAVEHCYCPEGYQGLSCEDCAFGYTRGDGGLYLGSCEPCNCNGHSNECHAETGECFNCRDHTTGRFCEQCLPGYEGDPEKGIPCRFREGGSCQCDPRGSISNECYNGVCTCKPNVEGNMCDRCRHGTFGLNSSAIDGCQSCFCSGVARECSESSFYVEQIPTQILDEESHGFTITDQNLQRRISNNFQFNYAINEISYRLSPGEPTLYWTLPQILTGNQIKSYGGKLEFRQRYSEQNRGRPIPDKDVIIIGDRVTIFWTNPNQLIPDMENRISVPILTSSGWQRLDQSSGPRPASREDILIALSSIREILVRATPTDTTQITSISDVTLDTAIDPYTTEGKATSVEVCRCPIGYEGSSCESCMLGYYRDENDIAAGPLGSCAKCPCTENAHGCSMGPDNTVICHCISGFTGSRCENDENNNTGDGSKSTVPPPITINVTITAPNINIYEIGSTLRLNCSAISYRTQTPARIIWTKDGGSLPETAIDDGRGVLIITNLKVSDSGRYICEAQDGYSIVTEDIVVKVGNTLNTPPRVAVNPTHVDIQEGQRIEIQCAASGNPAPNYILQRLDNQPLNSRHFFDNGIFRIDRAELSDAGQYNCIAQNRYGSDTAIFDVFVRVADFVRVTIEPSSVRTTSGQGFTLRCLSPNSMRDVRWSKEYGQLPYDAREENGVLVVSRARAQDSGVYICTVTNNRGASGQGTAKVEIIDNEGVAPIVTVSPETMTISRGQSIELRCNAKGSPPPTIKWTKLDTEMTEHIQQIGSVLYMRNVDERDAGTYICVAMNPLGLSQAHVDVNVNRGQVPTVIIYPNSTQSVLAGQTLDLDCVVDGGTPARITWSRRNGLPLSRNIEQFQRGNIRFNQISKSEEGEYICQAENEAGAASAVAYVYVQTPPEIRIVPDQKVINKREGDSLTLECHGSGTPPPNVYWTKYGNQDPVRSLEAPLNYAIKRFNKLSRSDEGLYICNARSNSGTVSKRVQLTVDTLPQRGDITGEDAQSGNDNGFKDLDRRRNPNDINTYIAPVGTKAELRCTISSINGNEQMDTQWIRSDNGPLPENAYIRRGTLYIDNVQESAKGLYSCLVTRKSTGQQLFTLNAYLDVISPPNITLVPKRQVVHPGDNAVIQCSANGQQPITISWTPMGREFPDSVNIRDGLLKFNNIKLSDAGRYRCTAVNSAGEADAVADVFVQETSYRPSISAVNKSPLAPVGSSVLLQCHIDNATTGNIRWFRDRLPLPDNSHITPENNLQITNAQKSNEGRYYCEIPTSTGYASDFVDLRITGPSNDNLIEPALYISPPERNYRLGENIDINCQSNQPGAITTWSKPSGWLGDNVQNVGGTLRILGLRRENAGSYRCEATGYQGVYHKDYNLRILEENSPLQAPTETKVAPKGSGIVLDCRTELREPISYQWSKAGGELPRYIDPNARTITLNDLSSSDAGAYMCTAKDANRMVKIPVILVITGIVPYFTQAPASFIALPTLMDHYIQFSFEIAIKPEMEDGLILYNGNKQGERGADFISLALVEGFPVFKYNLGHSPTVLRGKSISIGQWHTIKVVRHKKKVTMYVDGEGPYVANAEGKYIGLDLSENLYLGGVPRFDNISPEVETETGFVGCISRFKVGHNVQDILRDAIEKEGVTNCETCSENRCQNRGVCQESLTNEGYICICQSGFSGATCNKLKGEACSPYSCGSGRCVDNEVDFECICPMGKSGRRCEKDIEVEEPAFQNDAYIAYNVPKQRRLKYSLKFKPNSTSDGILLYCAETEEGHGDFASLSLKDQHVEFRFDVGNGPTIIRSPRTIHVGESVAVTATRSLSEGRLIVSGDTPVIERSPGNNKTPNLMTYLYVGGIDKHNMKVNHGVGVTSGFEGCISDLNVGGTEINMIRSAIDSSNVQDCSNIHHNNDMNNNIGNGLTSPPYKYHETGCSSNPCRNDGICYPLSPISYQCSCVNGYSGKDCEIAPNQCEYLKPCQNNGICKGNTTYYSCDCPLGFTGTNCEQRAELKLDVHFDGNGYLEFDKEMLPHLNQDNEEVIGIELSTNSSNGLIFWHGQSPNQDAQGQDYIALSLVNGYLEFSYDLGSGPAIIHNSLVRVNDGERHLVILKRQGRSGSIEIDRHHTQKDVSVGSANHLTCRGNIYLGGTPNIPLMTANKYSSGFVGCIHVFEIQGTNQIDLGRKALSGLNVKPCSSYEGIYSYENNEDNILDIYKN